MHWLLVAMLSQGVPDQTEPQLVLPCVVTEVYDGDTVTVRLTLDVRVRLLDCWAPEIRTKDQAEKKAGLKAKAELEQLTLGKRCLLKIPLTNLDRLDDLFTFGRLLARLIVVDGGIDASDHLNRAGLTTREKQAGTQR